MALSVTVHGIVVVAGPQTHGRWATADITTTDGTDNIIYTIPDGIDYAITSLIILNRDVVAATEVSIAISQTDVPNPEDFIEWNGSMVPRGVLERTQMVLNSGDRIIVRVGS
jgi:hypothetical protein